MPQQTIELAIDTESGGRLAAAELLGMPESQFYELRRRAMAQRIARRKDGHDNARFRCAICERPLWISRYHAEGGNRWFKHDAAAPDCPWYEGHSLSPDLQRALIYRGQQEGAQHREIKNFLSRWLEREPGVSDIKLEQVTHGQVLEGEWKRPDVQCVRDGKRIVFEIQLSYTFLSDVIRRDEFYRHEGIFIIWVFRALELQRAVVLDEAFFNRRNLFILDESAEAETARRERLTFTGAYQQPVVVDGVIEDEWRSKPVTLAEVLFPVPSFRPYFFDYDNERAALTAALKSDPQREPVRRDAKISRAAEQQAANAKAEWAGLVQMYLNTARHYYETGFDDGWKQRLVDVATVMHRNPNWEVGAFDCLKEESFFGWAGVLMVFLSFKQDRPLGYRVKTTFQVLEAGLRKSVEGRKHAMAIPYLWASRAFNITLNQRQRIWRKNFADEVKRSVENLEATYLRYQGFDEALGLLFPEIKAKLADPFGTQADWEARLAAKQRPTSDR